MFVPPEIARLLDGADPQLRFPHSQAETVIAAFVLRHVIRVTRMGLTRTRKWRWREEPDLERLEDVDEVWALCFRKPRPGWRLLGRFLAQDVFVGLRCKPRMWLGLGDNYQSEANETIALWSKLFGNDMVRSGDLAEYLSGDMYYDLDAQEG